MEQAWDEIGETDVRHATALALLVGFMALIGSGPLATLAAGLRGESHFDTRISLDPTGDGGDWSLFAANRRLLEAINELSGFLERDNWLATVMRPSAQSLLTKLGAGTEQVLQGRDGWLFFKPDVDHVIGPGFLRESQLARRAAIGDTVTEPPQPDPRVALRDFAEELAGRNVALVVVPTPVKPAVHPEHLARGLRIEQGVVNPSRDRFLRELREAGILVFDPLPVMLAIKPGTGTPLFLATDTHWRPETVEAMASRLAAFVDEHVELPSLPSPDYRVRETVVSNTGDTAGLLDLPRPDGHYPKERVSVRTIETASGEPWRPEVSADVLVLGDSFSNVFSSGAMGWGESGGLVEQLSYEMRRPLDRLARNDDGAFASRQMLADELRRGRDRLQGKRLVVYQFTERELSQGDWKLLDLGEPPATIETFLRPGGGGPIVVRGVIADIAPAPRPGSVPYKDHIIAVHLVDLETEDSSAASRQALVFMWSMRDNVPTPAARYRAGQSVHLRLTPWSEVSDELDRINRAELPDDSIRLAPPWWGEPVGQ